MVLNRVKIGTRLGLAFVVLMIAVLVIIGVALSSLEFQYQISLSDQDRSAAEEAYHDARTTIIAVGAVVLLLSGFLVLRISRSITSPLEVALGLAQRVAAGDLTGQVEAHTRDEVGQLLAALGKMIESLTKLVGQVQDSGIHVTSSAIEIASSAKEQQRSASEIAATTTEIGVTSREISATSQKLVEAMTEVCAVAEQTATLAGLGQSGLSTMKEAMHKVMDAVRSINANLAALDEKAGNINRVITTITMVADQTNLLSLNAAIEAEKAGENGRGFSVVATEIRRLADQTAVATCDIEQMVKGIQSAASGCVMGMETFSEQVDRGMQRVGQMGSQLSQIIQQVQALAPRFEAVNEGMQAQATGAEQISQALVHLSEATRQTVESLRHSNQSIDGLIHAADRLRSGVARFVLAETGGGAGVTAWPG
jgi:methyl-accepting chemotaxis protein WspA